MITNHIQEHNEKLAAIRDKETVKKFTAADGRTKSIVAALHKGTKNLFAKIGNKNLNKDPQRIDNDNDEQDLENTEKKGISLTSVRLSDLDESINSTIDATGENMLDISAKGFDEEIKNMIKGNVVDILIIALIIIIAMGIMHSLEGWDFSDSFYFTVVTISTVGYGDFKPTNDRSRTFIIFYTIFGTALLVRSCTNLVKIPLLIRARKNELDIIRQFGGENLQLTADQLKAVFEAEIFQKYPTIKKNENEMSKAEFVILLLSMMDRINEKDLILACKLFDKLDRNDRRYLHKDDITFEIQRMSELVEGNQNRNPIDNNLKTSLL
jgi:hypothetical protein